MKGFMLGIENGRERRGDFYMLACTFFELLTSEPFRLSHIFLNKPNMPAPSRATYGDFAKVMSAHKECALQDSWGGWH